MRPMRLALTKGRLEKKTVEMLEQLGYDCSQVRNKGRRLWSLMWRTVSATWAW